MLRLHKDKPQKNNFTKKKVWTTDTEINKEFDKIEATLGDPGDYNSLEEYFLIYKKEFISTFGEFATSNHEPSRLTQAREYFAIDWEAHAHTGEDNEYWRRRVEKAQQQYFHHRYKYDILFRKQVNDSSAYNEAMKQLSQNSKTALHHEINTVKNKEESEFEKFAGERAQSKVQAAFDKLDSI